MKITDIIWEKGNNHPVSTYMKRGKPITTLSQLEELLKNVKKYSNKYHYYFSIKIPKKKIDCEIYNQGSYIGSPMYMFANEVSLKWIVDKKQYETFVIRGHKKKIPNDILIDVLEYFEKHYLPNPTTENF